MEVPCIGRVPSGALPIMGILNVTPDSFSDGGRWNDVDAALKHAFDMVDQGACIIDVGAESTRPGSIPVTAEEELARMMPVLKELIPSLSVPVSVDTMKAPVAEACIGLGVRMVNDVNGLRGEGMMDVCASSDVSVCIMHMDGLPEHMHDHTMGTSFKDDIRAFLSERTSAAVAAGISTDRIMVDPGVGFGKTAEQNLAIVSDASYFSCGCPVLIGASRKRFLSECFPGADRDDATAKVSRMALDSGASLVRVHDVARTAFELTM